MSKHGHMMVMITDYKSSDFHLKGHDIESASPKIKYCSIEFDAESVNKYTKHTCCTPIASTNPSDEKIIMHQWKACTLPILL